MIISEKQIMQLINLVYEYRTWLALKHEQFSHTSDVLFEIGSQQSEELKDIK